MGFGGATKPFGSAHHCHTELVECINDELCSGQANMAFATPKLFAYFLVTKSKKEKYLKK
jgi:hypothetical protein